MTESLRILKAIEYAFVAAVVASLLVLVIAAFVFGFHFALWQEWQGRVVGVVATIAAVAAAALGVRTALRAQT